MCEAKRIFESEEYKESKTALFKSIKGLETISNAPFFGSWVINKEFETMTISEQMSHIVFNNNSDKVKHRSVKEFDYDCKNTNKLLCIFDKMNKYVLENFDTKLNRYDLFQFFIKFKDANNKDRFWRVIKYVEPAESKRDEWKFIVTHALFLDIINEPYETSIEQLTSLKRRKLIVKIDDEHEIYLLKKA